ncbi:MAG TPA: hypothetical protein VGL94_12925 [Ktedonobacteraceae bacterium]
MQLRMIGERDSVIPCLQTYSDASYSNGTVEEAERQYSILMGYVPLRVIP